jgi:hypothetical protein
MTHHDTDSDDGHPALDGYAIDTDYCGVDNRNPTFEQARDALTDADDRPPDASPTDERRLPRRDYDQLETTDADSSHLFYEGQATNNERHVSAAMDATSYSANDGRSLTRTYWDASDVPPDKRQQYARLLEYQEGQWDKWRDKENKQADNRRALDTFAARLDCTDHQEAVATEILDGVDLSHLGPYSHRHGVLGALSIATFLTDQRDIKDEQKYVTLCEEIDTTRSHMRNVRSLLRQKSTYLRG